MAYSKTTWVNNSTPLNATNMNKIEDGIASMLPLAGGNITGSICASAGGSFVNHYTTAPFKNTSYGQSSSYNSVIGSKTASGKWTIGNLSSEELLSFVYTLDSRTENGYDAKVNLAATSGSIVTTASILNIVYPVGSIYMSINNVSPQSFIGGTWVSLTDRFLLAAGSTYTAGNTGGTTSHQHTYGLTYAGYYSHTVLENGGTNAIGLHKYTSSGSYTLSGGGTSKANPSMTTPSTTGQVSTAPTTYAMTGTTTYTSNMPPYLVVYMWKRTA